MRGNCSELRRIFRGGGEGLATRQAGNVLLGGASGAGSLLLNTKASQEAACSRAPAAIVPGQEPESREPIRRNRLTPGRGGCRRGPRRAGWRFG